MLELIDQIPPDQEIAGVTADGTFDTRGAAAIILPPRNGKPWKPDAPEPVERNEALRVSKRFRRTISRRSSGYHR